MTLLGPNHEDLGAELVDRTEWAVVDHYGRPAVAHRAVRNGVGVIEMGYGIVSVTGSERVDYVDNIVTNHVPDTDGEGCYAFVLSPQGQITTDCYIYNADEQLLLFTPPSQVDELVADWSEKIFVQDVAVENVSSEFGVFGVHGPSATEKVASVLNHAGAPEPELHFDRGSMGDAGVTVVAGDNPTGEDGYTVICEAEGAPTVFDTLLNHGLNAAPFGYRTWETLTLEAGTPRFETELQGEIPNTVGARHALDFEKGCYIGQEVVSKVENRGRPSKELVGLTTAEVVDADDDILVAGDDVGRVTRAAESPSLDDPIALGFVSTAADEGAITVDSDAHDEPVAAERTDLPFVSGSADSLRRPQY